MSDDDLRTVVISALRDVNESLCTMTKAQTDMAKQIGGLQADVVTVMNGVDSAHTELESVGKNAELIRSAMRGQNQHLQEIVTRITILEQLDDDRAQMLRDLGKLSRKHEQALDGLTQLHKSNYDTGEELKDRVEALEERGLAKANGAE